MDMRAPSEPTQAHVIAGRVISEWLMTFRDLRALQAAVKRFGGEIVAVAAGDLTPYPGSHHADPDPTFLRVAIGVPVAVVGAASEPRELTSDVLREGLRVGAAIGPAIWREIADCLQTPPRFASTHMRSGAPAGLLDGVVLDRDELLAAKSELHLVPSGPLAHAQLVAGELGPLRLRNGEAPPGWFFGQNRHQEPHRTAVRGRRIATASAEGRGTAVIPTTELGADRLYLIARYD